MPPFCHKTSGICNPSTTRSWLSHMATVTAPQQAAYDWILKSYRVTRDHQRSPPLKEPEPIWPSSVWIQSEPRTNPDSKGTPPLWSAWSFPLHLWHFWQGGSHMYCSCQPLPASASQCLECEASRLLIQHWPRSGPNAVAPSAHDRCTDRCTDRCW